VLLVLLVPLWPVTAQDIEQQRQSRFGIVEAYYRPADAHELGVGWERIIFEWAQFQPNNAEEYHTEVVPDRWLADARDSGREVIGLLKNTPRWASTIRELGAPPHGLDLPIDDPANYWAAFVRRTVQYYGDNWGIHHWIIYNEPDIRPGEMPWYEFDGEVQDYFEMVKVAYLAAKSVNPDAVIHLAGMAWWTDVQAGRQPYLRRFLDIAAADPDARRYGFYFDVAMVHVYFGTQNVWNLIVETRGILEHYNLGHKPIWVDETNASPTLDPLAPMSNPAYQVKLEQQADYIVQAAALSLAAGAERFAVYRLYDDHYQPGSETWGLVRADGTRRPAFTAYQTVIRLFSEATHARHYWSDRSMLVVLRLPGQTAYVMWARQTEPVRFHIWASGVGDLATRISVSGLTREIEAAEVRHMESAWFVIDTPGALPDESGSVMIQGSPVILVMDGPPHPVWVEVGGIRWQLTTG
jgi:hypothetical protein